MQQHDCPLLLVSNHLITLVTKVLLQLDKLLFGITQVSPLLGKLLPQLGLPVLGCLQITQCTEHRPFG